MGSDIKRHFTRFLPRKREVTKQSPTIPMDTPIVDSSVISERPKVAIHNPSRRTEDMSAESELARFLDKNLYGHFPSISSFDSIERVFNKDQQLSGIDVIFKTKDGRTFCVDEKAQLYYLNKGLPTFAFEIDFLRNGMTTTGWLCNNDLETDLYLLIWPFANKDSPKGIKSEDFTKADCMLVSKTAVLHLLESYGLTAERLLQDAKQIRKEGKAYKIPIPGISGIYYFASDPHQYEEAPINIVISKRLLMRIKQRRYIVTPEKVEME